MSADGQIEPDNSDEPGRAAMLPYENLAAPQPLPTQPPVTARWIAFGAILLGGLLGGMIGYGVLDISFGDSTISALGALGFGVGGAAGLGVVTSLTLRAMNEWHTVQHPEAASRGESATGPNETGR